MGCVAAIVQARIGSKRLPGKVLAEVDGQTVLSHVLARCQRISGVDVVVCAIPTGSQDDQVATEAEKCGVVVVRGAEDDVLNRYRQAARVVDADAVLRITSDNALIDPDLCDRVLRLFSDANVDYACNNMPQTWPQGADCEAFSRSALDLSATKLPTAYDREHVTPMLRTNPVFSRVNLCCSDPALRSHRWTLDHPEDLRFLQALAATGKQRLNSMTMSQILEVLAQQPELRTINARAPATGQRSGFSLP